MELLVVSDSHGDFLNLQKLIERHGDIDTIVHLGDGAQEIWQLGFVYPQKQFVNVLGNNDLEEEAPLQRVLTVENTKILLTHGHKFPLRKRHKSLAREAKALGAQAVFYGHTHVFFEGVVDGVYVLNPGAVKFGRDRANRYAVVRILEDGTIKTESRLCNE